MKEMRYKVREQEKAWRPGLVKAIEGKGSI
jgi:hypothetical protein